VGARGRKLCAARCGSRGIGGAGAQTAAAGSKRAGEGCGGRESGRKKRTRSESLRACSNAPPRSDSLVVSLSSSQDRSGQVRTVYNDSSSIPALCQDHERAEDVKLNTIESSPSPQMLRTRLAIQMHPSFSHTSHWNTHNEVFPDSSLEFLGSDRLDEVSMNKHSTETVDELTLAR
jgi:hypothetical protein